ncbi:hypothetical protein AAG906_030095 [Vitis piasezkii]
MQYLRCPNSVLGLPNSNYMFLRHKYSHFNLFQLEKELLNGISSVVEYEHCEIASVRVLQVHEASCEPRDTLFCSSLLFQLHISTPELQYVFFPCGKGILASGNFHPIQMNAVNETASDPVPGIPTAGVKSEVVSSLPSVTSNGHFSFAPEISGMSVDTSALHSTFTSDVSSSEGLQLGMMIIR